MERGGSRKPQLETRGTLTIPLSDLARRLESEPEFFAYALARYRERMGMTPEQARHLLGLDERQMTRLALCRLPRGDNFVADVMEVANDMNINPEALAAVVLAATGEE